MYENHSRRHATRAFDVPQRETIYGTCLKITNGPCIVHILQQVLRTRSRLINTSEVALTLWLICSLYVLFRPSSMLLHDLESNIIIQHTTMQQSGSPLSSFFKLHAILETRCFFTGGDICIMASNSECQQQSRWDHFLTLFSVHS